MNTNDDDGSAQFRVQHLEDVLDDVRTAAHIVLARADALVDLGNGATHEQIVEMAQLLRDELTKIEGA